jgi:hypothetical protein
VSSDDSLSLRSGDVYCQPTRCKSRSRLAGTTGSSPAPAPSTRTRRRSASGARPRIAARLLGSEVLTSRRAASKAASRGLFLLFSAANYQPSTSPRPQKSCAPAVRRQQRTAKCWLFPALFFAVPAQQPEPIQHRNRRGSMHSWQAFRARKIPQIPCHVNIASSKSQYRSGKLCLVACG